MADDVRTVLLLPAFNEAEALPLLLARVRGVDEVLVVDDGSDDDTAAVARRYGRVIRHERNRGLGAAMRTGLAAVASAQLGDGDVVVTMDADNTHDPDLIPELRRVLAAGADVAIASRFCPGAREIGLAWHRRLLTRGASLLLRTLRPVDGVRDYSSGYRAYRVGIVRRALAHYGAAGLVASDGFDCMAEILLRLAALGARFGEVPLELHYERKRGGSKLPVVRTIAGYVSLLRRVPAGGVQAEAAAAREAGSR
jgi:dolichol-phosphate mannosyltransferase